jgi:YVTN family beta-propeller protein
MMRRFFTIALYVAATFTLPDKMGFAGTINNPIVGDGNDIALYSLAIEEIIFADGFEPAPLPAQVYVLDSGERNVTVISTKTNTVVTNIRVGLNPTDMAITPDGALIYVPNLGHDTVTVISTVTNAVVATVGVGAQPWRVVVTPDGAFVYVTHEGDTIVSVISTATNTVVDTIGVGNARAILAFIPDGTLAYVLVPFVGVQVISTVTNTVVDTIVDPFVWPAGIAITPDGAFAYIAETDSAIVLVLSIASNTVIAKVGVDITNPIEMIITPDGTMVYMVNPTGGIRVSAVSTASNTEVASIEMDTGLFMSMAVKPDSSLLYVSDLFEDTVSVIPTATNTITATIDIVNPPVPIGGIHGPRTMALTKDADFLYVANGIGAVSVISTATNMVIATVENVGFDDPVKIVITP